MGSESQWRDLDLSCLLVSPEVKKWEIVIIKLGIVIYLLYLAQQRIKRIFNFTQNNEIMKKPNELTINYIRQAKNTCENQILLACELFEESTSVDITKISFFHADDFSNNQIYIETENIL